MPVTVNISIFGKEIRMDIFLINESVLLILPTKDFNEQEYLVISRELEKAGKKIFIASDSHSLCYGTNGLKVKSDVQFFNINENNFGGIIFIGGRGVRNYWNNTQLHLIVNKFNKKKRIIGAICSAPVILAKAGLLNGTAVCYPEDKNELVREGIEYKDEPVIINKNFITGRDSAASKEFADSFIYALLKIS